MVDKVITLTGGADAEAETLKNKILYAKDLIGTGNNTYYLSERGDDSNDGLSPERPIKSFLHIADLPLKCGDSVLLERGSVFRAEEMLWIKSGVSYGAYGEGAKPYVLGSVRDFADPDIWKQTENKAIWCTDLRQKRAGIITFDNDTYVGIWKYHKCQLLKDGDFYHDVENGIFYLYFEAGNPGKYFNNIEISTAEVAIRGNDLENVKVDNIYFKYHTVGAFLFGECNGITLTNCVMGWGGGKIFNIGKSNIPARFGNAVEFWHLGEDIVVENCWVYQQFDAALTFQGYGEETVNFKNISFADNLIEYCSMNIEFWARDDEDGTPAHIEDISYKGNIIRFAGYGWGGIQRFTKQNQAALLGWNYRYEDMQNFVITDNIIDCADCHMVYMTLPKENKGMAVYGNTYFQKPTSCRHSYVQPVKGVDIYANNDEQLKEAIATFDESPKLVKWLG